jgi:hypothetical protein
VQKIVAARTYENYSEEWKVCRETIDRFDGILVDLRKYGFSILTGLTTAGSFLGFSAPTANIQIGVIIVTMALIMVLYWLDIYYQSLIFEASFRARFLEIYRLKRNLSVYIAGFYGASHTGSILHFLYIGFLIGLVVLGVFVTDTLKKLINNFDDEARNNLIILFTAFSIALGGIITIYVKCDRSRTQRVREISDLIKTYIPYKNERERVNVLEDRLTKSLEKDL